MSGVTSSNLKTVADQKVNVTLEFSGLNVNVRLDNVVFLNHRGAITSKWSVDFEWSAAVKALSLLFVRAATTVFVPGNPTAEIRGGAGSAANSLDSAISRGAASIWLGHMFGTLPNGETFAKQVFARHNSSRKQPTRPVQVSVNEQYLPREAISVFRDGKPLLDERSLLQLADDIESAITPESRTRISAPLEASESTAGFSLYDIYKSVWTSPLALAEKIKRTRDLLTGSPIDPHIYLSYSMRVTAGRDNTARMEASIVICNCGVEPLPDKQQTFWFNVAQPISADVVVDPPNTFRTHFEDSNKKIIAIEFNPPIQPSESRRYSYSWIGFNMFTANDPYWDCNILVLTNHLSFHLTHEHQRHCSGVSVAKVPASGEEVFIEPTAPVFIDWGVGLTYHWQIAFPSARCFYRTRWKFESTDRPEPTS